MFNATVHPYLGSSPRVRGTSSAIAVIMPSHRFIPTSAGNIGLYVSAISNSTVHPHECGEHGSGSGIAFLHFGSSPRVRGTSHDFVQVGQLQRFIPTSAGNINPAAGQVDGLPVHPHECGEHESISSVSVSAPGSSPRVRGTFSGS